jgi:hypothetical protein
VPYAPQANVIDARSRRPHIPRSASVPNREDSMGINLRPIPNEAEVVEFPITEHPILAIPSQTRRWIIIGAVVGIGAVALAVTAVSLNDMEEGFEAALNLASWKAWILATLADILFIATEVLCIFAPVYIVALRVTSAIRVGAIAISMASNALSLSYIAPVPWVGIVAGIIMPLAIAACTYTIGYAVHHGSR